MKLKLIVSVLFVLFSFISVFTVPKYTEADTAPVQLLQMPNPEIAEMTAFMDKHKFAQTQYVLIPTFIKDAVTNQLPPALLLCIDLQESSGGRHQLPGTNNPFGWQSDRVGFTSWTAGVDFVSNALATARPYKGKSLKGKLNAYNPNPAYATEIIACINNSKIT